MIQAAETAPRPAEQVPKVNCGQCGTPCDRALCDKCQSWNPRFSVRQSMALSALGDPGVEEVLYGGAKGGGKSAFGVQWVMLQCLGVIAEHGLGQPQRYPPAVAWMGRKRSVDFNDTTLEAWKQLIPGKFWRIAEQKREIVVLDRVKVDYGGLDNTESVSKFQSAQYGFLFLDQAEETSLDDVAALRATLNRLRVNGRLVPPKALFTANPPLKPSWLRNEFIKAPSPRQRFIRALPTDNPWLPASYIETLRKSFKHRPELLAAMLDGKWDLAEGMNEVIRDSWVQAAHQRTLLPSRRWRFLVADTARFGDDESVMYAMDETEILPEFSMICGHKDSMWLANHLFVTAKRMAEKYREKQIPIWVEEMGPSGPGIVDRLREMGAWVFGVNTSNAAANHERFVNLRAEIWWLAGEMFGDGDVSLRYVDPDLDGQLVTPTYDYRSGKILVQDKEEIKEELGRSPDRADAYVIGLHALRHLRVHQPKPTPVVEPVAVGSFEWSRQQNRRAARQGDSRW